MADGRAVVRSSLREFVASEAMAALGVPTTRALCLVATGDQVLRDMFYKCARLAACCPVLLTHPLVSPQAWPPPGARSCATCSASARSTQAPCRAHCLHPSLVATEDQARHRMFSDGLRHLITLHLYARLSYRPSE